MGSLYDVVAGLSAMRDEIKKMSADAVETTEKVREMNEARGEETTAGKTSQPSSPATSIGATSLGNPRDASDQAARMYAAIEAAKRR